MSGSISVLVCAFNGEAHLTEQLDSILQQDVAIQVHVSDDGSMDGTCALLDDYQARYPQFAWYRGPNQGFVSNFFELICSPLVDGKFFALADQDDVWLPGHLERAKRLLERVPEGRPALVASRTCLVDARLAHLALSPAHEQTPNFHNALVQNIASGNTMVFNASARALMRQMARECLPPWHDWALYQVVTACGGQVFYSQEPTVLYRQHGNNAIGAQWTLASRWHRVRKLLQARFRDWNTRNLQALEGIAEHMTPENRALMARFAEVRQRRTPWGRVIGLYRLGLYRQTRVGQLGLYVAAFLKLM